MRVRRSFKKLFLLIFITLLIATLGASLQVDFLRADSEDISSHDISSHDISSHDISSHDISSDDISEVATPTGIDISDELVYLGSDGQIRVLDLTQTNFATPLKWTSLNDKGFFDFTLGDLTGDGDMEIIAIRPKALDGLAGQVVIYDPVILNGVSSGDFNGVHWRTIATLTVEGDPNLVAAGDFDTTIKGDEFVVGYTPSLRPPTYRIEIYHDLSSSHDGSNWVKYISQDFDFTWRDSSVGDVFAGGPKELLLSTVGSANEYGRMYLYRFENGFASVCSYVSFEGPPYDATILQWQAGGGAEIAMSRGYPTDLFLTQNRIFVYRCETNGTLTILDQAKNFPEPVVLVGGDLDKSGEEDLLFLRSTPSASTLVHLFGRRHTSNGAGTPLAFEARLDADNGYQALSLSDVDGDLKKEVVVMRNNNIRVYTAPESSTNPATFYTDYAIDSNLYALESGDLDRNGTQYIPPNALRVTPASINFVLYPCNAAFTTQSASLLVEGESGTSFQVTPPGAIAELAAVEESTPTAPPLWFLGVSPLTGAVGSTLTLSIDPVKRASNFEQTQITITSLPPAAPVTLSVSVTLLCAQSQLLLPFAPR